MLSLKQSIMTNKKATLFLFLFSFLTCYLVVGQTEHSHDNKREINFVQIKTDSLFNSKQIISLLTIQENYRIEIGYSVSDLKPTSSFGIKKNAIAAVNGSFFDMDHGGSVTYFEMNDTVITRTRDTSLKWAVPDSLVNGVVVLSDNYQVVIQPAKTEDFYEMSKNESAVLVSGPILLYNSEEMRLPDMSFVHKRHPRTCLCNTDESLVLITIDGRSEDAEGMNLYEVQEYLKSIGCIDAINLDGGGSTTMWTRDKGIVNFPSDRSGERPVANAILVIDKIEHSSNKE